MRHLLIEIRSLGFVEVQGRDTGGIYERLSDWLVKNWNVTDRPHQGFILAGSDQLADCCGTFYTYAYELGPLEEHHKLCERSWILGPSLEDTGVPILNDVFKARRKRDQSHTNLGKLRAAAEV